MRMIQQQQQQKYPLQNQQQQQTQYPKTQRDDIQNTQKPQKIRELSQIIKTDTINQDKVPYNFSNHTYQIEDFSTQRKRSKTSFLKNFDLETAKSTILDKQTQEKMNERNNNQVGQQKVSNNTTSACRSNAIPTFSETSLQQINNNNSYVDKDEFRRYRNLIGNKTKASKSQILHINTSFHQQPQLDDIDIVQDIKQQKGSLQIDQKNINVQTIDHKVESKLQIQTDRSVNNLQQVSYKNQNEITINTNLECNQSKMIRTKSQRDNVKYSSMHFQKGYLNLNNHLEDYQAQKVNQTQISDRIQTLPEQNYQQNDEQLQNTFQEQEDYIHSLQKQKQNKIQRKSQILDNYGSESYQPQTHRQNIRNDNQVDDIAIMKLNCQNNKSQHQENITYLNKTANQDIINYNSILNEKQNKYNSLNKQQKKSVEREPNQSHQNNLNYQIIQNNNHQQQNNNSKQNIKQIEDQNQTYQNNNTLKNKTLSNQQPLNSHNQIPVNSHIYSQLVELNERQKEQINQYKEEIFQLSSCNNQLVHQIKQLESEYEKSTSTIKQQRDEIQILQLNLQSSNKSNDLAILQHQQMLEQIQKLQQEVQNIQEKSSRFALESHLSQQQQNSSATQFNSVDLKNYTSHNNCSFDETSSPFSNNNFPSTKSITTTSAIFSQKSSTCIIKPQSISQQYIQQQQQNDQKQNIYDEQNTNKNTQEQNNILYQNQLTQNKNSKEQQVITAKDGLSIFEQTFSLDDQQNSQDSKKSHNKMEFFENQLTINGQKISNSSAFDILYQIFQKFGEGQVNQLNQLPEKVGNIMQENKSNIKFIKSMKELTMKCAPNNYFESSEPSLKIIWKFITRVMEEYTTLKSKSSQMVKQNQKQSSNQFQNSQYPQNNNNNNKTFQNNTENNDFSNYCNINTVNQQLNENQKVN